ncbi:MAG TPA: hypothetical protein VGF25_19370 [Thermoleophilaceae bacterium]|jgi:hypothetical protein
MRTRRLISALAAAAVAAGAAAGPAAADSIVYAKAGNLFLTSPDGSKGYQVTFDGGYSSPSQADNGTIGALRNDQLVRLDRSGRLLNQPIAAMGSAGPGSSSNIGGPYEPRISPDGTRFAYYFYVQTSFDDYYNDIRWIDTGSYGTWTYADHFTSPATESEYNRSLVQTEWVTNDRLLGTAGMFLNMWTWKLGTGHGYTWDAAQWWFGLQDPPDQWGVAAYHWYDDPALSRDGTKLAMTDGGNRLEIAATHGPAWSGQPPYAEVDYVNPVSSLNAPTIECQTGEGKYANPSWSTDGDTLAYGMDDGVHVMSVPDGLDCSRATQRLLVAGGSEPAFGRADVSMSQAPHGRGGGGGGGGGGVSIRKLSLHPRAFRAGKGARVSYTLSAPAKVRLTVATARGKRVRGSLSAKGKAGANRVRFSGRVGGRKLRPGAYRLRVTAAGGAAASARFRIVR